MASTLVVFLLNFIPLPTIYILCLYSNILNFNFMNSTVITIARTDTRIE